MHRSRAPDGVRRPPPPPDPHHRRGCLLPHQDNYQRPPLLRPPYQQNRPKPQFSPPYRDRPPGPPPSPARPNFIVQLRSDAQRPVKQETEAVVQKLRFQPQKSHVISCNYIAGTLHYEQWSEALETVVELWEMKLGDMKHNLWPRVIFIVQVPSDKSELNDRLKLLFLGKLKELEEGDIVKKWRRKLGILVDEIHRISLLLRKPQRLVFSSELLRKREGLEAERDLILKRVEEFKSALCCIENYLENGENDEGGVIPIFRFTDGEINWWRIHKLLTRECRRLDDGLPIYAHRREILKQIDSQQVTVLIGETGSGKSTQLVQFLADSGFADHEAIVCTQPRKLAAISLAERVKEETYDCYNDTLVSFYPSSSSIQESDSKVKFMTDHCLLQHYMSDNQLSRISCIIVDEAHERSLNTDLLLALIRNVLIKRSCLRLVIMSATADADQFAHYFFGCTTLHVAGRNFPVDIKYVSSDYEKPPPSKLIPTYVLDVLRMVTEINKTKREGTILAFLTSQMEVEWACEELEAPSAIALPLHGKLSYEDQHRVFLTYPGKRKVIFATNIAETSLTIPGVKYVVDPGMVKDSRFESGSGMNVLRVCRISQSSANQRAGRAGRTEPGTCYRLYSERDFESMLPHQEPEIRKANLGVAVLKIVSLGIKDVQKFDFVDSPSVNAIDVAVRSLIQIGAIAVKGDVYDLTAEGREIVKLGIEPRLGKIILQCFRQRLGKEGLVLAAVMPNSSSIFCRVGTYVDKSKSDCQKVQFCHPSGDLFTLLAVYKEWEALPREKKNIWCWENSINAKSLRRCQDTVLELEACLRNELNIIVPNYWCWNPQLHTKHDKKLKNIILSSLSDNVAMYSGYDQLGYEVALTRKHVQLHPSCSLLNFGQRPAWVVFGDILSISNEYLVCVSACNFEQLPALSPPPRFDFLSMINRQLQKVIISGFGSILLKKFCGKSNTNLSHLVSSIRESCADERIGIEVNVDKNVITLYATSQDMDKVRGLVNEGLESEKKFLQNECLEKCLYNGGPKVLPSFALVGAGAEIKHLEIEKRYLTVDIFHSKFNALDDRELLVFLERFTSGHVCVVSKFFGSGLDNEDKDKWGRVTFLTPEAAKTAVELNNFMFSGGLLKVLPSRNVGVADYKTMSFPSVRANIYWPRRCSKGVGIIKCDRKDVASIVDDLSNLIIGGRLVWCEASVKSEDSVVVTGLDKNLSEPEIYQLLSAVTNRRILDFFLFRGNPIEDPPLVTFEQAILREIFPFMPRRNTQGNVVGVQVSQPYPKDIFMKASITFDGSLHLEAAKALEQIDGKALPGCHVWQKVRCEQLFHSSVCCPAPVYTVIRADLDALLSRLRQRNGVEWCILERNPNGSYRVKISATATKIVADLRTDLEQLMKGKILQHPDITPAVLQVLFSWDGITQMKNIQQETRTHIIFDKHRMLLRVFGPPAGVEDAESRLVCALLSLHESKQLEIRLRDGSFPPDMMKRVVQHFGPDLRGLEDKFPNSHFTLETRRHSIFLTGNKELKQKVEEIIHDLARTEGLQPGPENADDPSCPVCLCELEDPHALEGCGHRFCRMCLVEQCESAIKSHDGFPLKCAREGCGAYILVADLKTLLNVEKLDELFQSSLAAYVAGSGGVYRFCPSPDCPSVYRVASPGEPGAPFTCEVCLVETCTGCHLEYHPYLSCEKYREFKDDPDLSLKEWCVGKEHVKVCPSCGFTIEKVDGCNHIECKCGSHVCWVCLQVFGASEDCYSHLRSVHEAII
ncbi:helicase domain-containing protein / IBR domain-containing protein / zinc finger protein-related [Striga hermonthica]|uniref:RNA helicase n=1 Tax=Striga hermonthica TaxID=68872 RepID=A0A9N7R532_STRHE|nr:helicase domain-containing protein / IBR domain-containing protein / zinc finger protein-related [Striga hermonthica]